MLKITIKHHPEENSPYSIILDREYPALPDGGDDVLVLCDNSTEVKDYLADYLVSAQFENLVASKVIDSMFFLQIESITFKVKVIEPDTHHEQVARSEQAYFNYR